MPDINNNTEGTAKTTMRGSTPTSTMVDSLDLTDNVRLINVMKRHLHEHIHTHMYVPIYLGTHSHTSAHTQRDTRFAVNCLQHIFKAVIGQTLLALNVLRLASF